MIGAGIGVNIVSWLLKLISSPGAGAAGPFNNHATLGNGLVSYWALDETSGVRYDSVVASANDLTDNNTVTCSPAGPSGTVADFDPASSERLRNTSADLQWGGNAFTVATWVKPDTGPDVQNIILGKDNNAGNGIEYRLVWLNNGAQQGFRWRGCGSGSNHDWFVDHSPVGEWHFFVGGYDGAGNLFSSLDGQTITTTAITPSGTGGAANFEIGGWTTADWDWDGKISRVGFWKGRALSQSDIVGLFNSGNGKAYADLTTAEKTNLTAYWNLDEVSGDRSDSHSTYDLTDVNTVTSVVNAGGAMRNVAANFVAASSEFLSRASVAGLSEWTVSMWATSTGVNPRFLSLAAATWPWNTNIAIYSSGGDFHCVAGNGVDSYSIASIAPSPDFSTIQHVIATYTSSDKKVRLYVNNGSAQVGTALTGTIYTTAATFNIGKVPPLDGNTHNGKVDEVGLWNRVLTAQERTDLWNSGVGLFYGD